MLNQVAQVNLFAKADSLSNITIANCQSSCLSILLRLVALTYSTNFWAL